MEEDKTVEILVNELAMAHAERHEVALTPNSLSDGCISQVSARADADRDVFCEEIERLKAQLLTLSEVEPPHLVPLRSVQDLPKEAAAEMLERSRTADHHSLQAANERLQHDCDKWRR